MREITFSLTFQDWLEGFKTGLAHLTALYQAFWSGLALLMTVGLLLMFWAKNYPATLPPNGLPPLHLLLDVGQVMGIMLASYLTWSVTVWFLTSRRTVIIQDKHLVNKARLWSNAISWRNVTDVLDRGHYLCFCLNVPTAIVIPRSAFPNPEQAQAFLEQAEHYWRRATDKRDPPPNNSADVWPPAPRPANSQEPDTAL